MSVSKIIRPRYLLSLIAILTMTFVFLVSFLDPIINYYGVEMRQSDLYHLLQTRPSEQTEPGLYCMQFVPFSIGASLMCFDTKAELDAFVHRRSQIQTLMEK